MRKEYECSKCGNVQSGLLDFDRQYNLCGICKNTYEMQIKIFNDELYFDINELQKTLTRFKAKDFNLNKRDILQLTRWYGILYGDLHDNINLNNYMRYDEEYISNQEKLIEFYEDIGILVINKFKEFKDKKDKIEKKYNKNYER